MVNIESKEAIQLSDKWGEKPCDHPSFGQEYNKSAFTGSFICMQCGAEFNKKQKEEIEEKRG